MIQVTEIAFTGYPVTDLPRARKFYEGVLNLKPSAVWGDDQKAWVEYDIGAGTLAITNSAPQWKPSSDGPAIGLEVADFTATIATLKAAGAKFMIEPNEFPPCFLAVVCDPDGNTVAIHHRKKQG